MMCTCTYDVHICTCTYDVHMSTYDVHMCTRQVHMWTRGVHVFQRAYLKRVDCLLSWSVSRARLNKHLVCTSARAQFACFKTEVALAVLQDAIVLLVPFWYSNRDVHVKVHIISARAHVHIYVHFESAHVHFKGAHVHFYSAHVHFLCSKSNSTSTQKQAVCTISHKAKQKKHICLTHRKM